MKRLRLILAFSICVAALNCFSQSKYGNVTMDEMTMTSYAPDTTASAVILLKKGETRFKFSALTEDFQFEQTIEVKIKILKSEGLDLCNQSILFYEFNNSNKEQINGLNGTTYNLEDGKIIKTKLSKEFITEENQDNNLKLKKFTMPAAKVGSVIEFKYTLVSDFYTHLRDFDFQNSVPTAYTFYEIRIPEYYRFNVTTKGYEHIVGDKSDENETIQLSYRDDNGRRQTSTLRCSVAKYVFKGENISALKQEPYMWTTEDYRSKVTFELQSIQYPYSTIKYYTTSWSEIDKRLFENEYFGNNLKKEGLFKDQIKPAAITIERARDIQSMIKSKVKWNDRNRMYPDDLKKALNTGVGSSADINFLLINALKAGGFNAFPVILSTRSNGKLPLTHPSVESFNNTITGILIDTIYYYTDASSRFGDWNVLPEKCIVTEARKMIENRCDWVDLTPLSTGNEMISGQYSFADNQLIKDIAYSSKGNSAYDFRSRYFSYKDQTEYLEKLAAETSSDIGNFNITGIEDPAQSLKMSYKSKTDFALGDEYLYLSPMIEKHISENPFKKETRIYPVNFDYIENYVQLVNIDIPEGYVVDALPKSERFVFGEKNDISLQYRILQADNQIKLQYQFQLKRLLFLPTEYEDLRDFFTKVVAKNSEQIVLKKAAAVAQ